MSKDADHKKAARATQTRVDTILITPRSVEAWEAPPFQRPLRVNDKVRAIAEEIKATGVLPGILTIGILNGKEYIIDGQHRCSAFLLSECKEGFTDVRYVKFETMADMGEEFVSLNSQLVRFGPDDILRGLEGSIEALRMIRKKCPFVGYDQIRRNSTSSIIGMSLLLRCWFASLYETPSTAGTSAAGIAREIEIDDAGACVDFLLLAEKAWGRDMEYARLWSGLNMTLCMWLYRRCVMEDPEPKGKKQAAQLAPEQFRSCMMSLSADTDYIDWLAGRKIGDRDRAPAYSRIKKIFQRRLSQDTGRRWNFPAPDWASHTSSRRVA